MSKKDHAGRCLWSSYTGSMSIKGLDFGTCNKNKLIYSQMTFHLDERHSLKAIRLESGKKFINWVSVGNFETLRSPYS